MLAPLRALAVVSVLGACTSGITTTDANAAATAGCGSYVVASMPLRDLSTGQASWNYGYVQLWFDSCTKENFAATQSLLGGTSGVETVVYNTDHESSSWGLGQGNPRATSPGIYSPIAHAGAAGNVEANGVAYYAEADQSGANCSTDYYDGLYPCEGA